MCDRVLVTAAMLGDTLRAAVAVAKENKGK